MCHIIGVCWLILSFNNDVIDDFTEWNEVNQVGKGSNDGKLLARLTNTIQLHASVKRLSITLAF